MNHRLIILALLISTTVAGQPTEPILRLENAMHTAISRRESVDKAGKYILTSSEDKTARLWDAATGQLLKIYRIPIDKNNEGKIYSCAIWPDATKAALGGWTGYEWDNHECIYIIDVQTGELLRRLRDLPDVVNDLEISADGKFLAAGFGDGSCYVYKTSSLELIKKIPSCGNTLNNVAFDLNNRLATVCYDGKVRLYDNTYTLVKEIETVAGRHPYSVVFNPNGTTLAVAYTDASDVELRDANTLQIIARPDIKGVYKGEMVNKLCFTTDGRYLVGG